MNKKAPKEGPEAEAAPDAVPPGKRGRAEKEQHGKPLDHPAEGVRAAEALLPVGDGGQILLRGGGEKALILNEADRAVEQEKIGQKDQERRKDGDLHCRYFPASRSSAC